MSLTLIVVYRTKDDEHLAAMLLFRVPNKIKMFGRKKEQALGKTLTSRRHGRLLAQSFNWSCVIQCRLSKMETRTEGLHLCLSPHRISCFSASLSPPRFRISANLFWQRRKKKNLPLPTHTHTQTQKQLVPCAWRAKLETSPPQIKKSHNVLISV